MDPHLRATREWNKNYLPNEKQAYHEARINGYVFPQLGPNDKIGTLWSDELEAIVSHPTIIDLKRYKYYRSMNIDQLKERFLALVDIIGPNITYEDLFYYATRGWIPEYDSINLKIDRYNQYSDLSDVSKTLIDRIYNDQMGFANSGPHPLEQTILAYDQHMDDDNALRAIAGRMGLTLPKGEYAHDSFYEILYDRIENELPYGDYVDQ